MTSVMKHSSINLSSRWLEITGVPTHSLRGALRDKQYAECLLWDQLYVLLHQSLRFYYLAAKLLPLLTLGGGNLLPE